MAEVQVTRVKGKGLRGSFILSLREVIAIILDNLDCGKEMEPITKKLMENGISFFHDFFFGKTLTWA